MRSTESAKTIARTTRVGSFGAMFTTGMNACDRMSDLFQKRQMSFCSML